MAAKVVIVAVPTVLSIASIRVYTVREESTDGLVPPEKLNIYTPLTQSAQAAVIPERPGVIESLVTAARERIQPLVQVVKGACSSVKRGSVKLYHTGEDVYYYLKDPPPEFLPRFGTITMAGLLGMFMARKGSRFKRVALPLGLMSAGASLCYPAQTVAVVKVTGRKLYAAGHWGTAAVSSLLTAKPQEPVTNMPGSSQPQATAVPNPESAVAEAPSTTGGSAKSSVIPETEVGSAEFVLLSDEPVVSVISEEASSETDTHADPVERSVPAETKDFAPSEEIPALVELEEPSGTKQTVENVSTHALPAESLPSLESEVVEASPVESASAEAAPVEGTLVDSPAPKVTCEPLVPVVESAQPEHVPELELADQPKAATAEETMTPELTAPAPQQSGAEHDKGGSGFKSDPSLMDYGQSSPEDEDLYSTRS